MKTNHHHPRPAPLPGGPPPEEDPENPTHLPVEPDDGNMPPPVLPEDPFIQLGAARVERTGASGGAAPAAGPGTGVAACAVAGGLASAGGNSGTRKVAMTGPCTLPASMASAGPTDFSQRPDAISAPTKKVRAGWPSMASSAAPWPLALAITPASRKRCSSPAATSLSASGGAPSTRASSMTLTAGTGLASGAAGPAAVGERQALKLACSQYPAESKEAPSNASVIRRRAASVFRAVFKAVMCGPSSTEGPPCGKRDRKRRVGLRQLAARGFTLIELMVVLAIIGVLAALIVPNVLDRADDARVSAARVDVSNLMQALKLYRLDNQRYPSAEQGLQALVQRPDKPPVPGNWKAYIDKLPNDPWGQPYLYANPGIQGEVDVMSYGADGKPGGEGNKADLGSWQ